MSVKQEDFIQLFGEWGYTAPQLKNKVASIKKEATSRVDKVGMIACSSFYAVCIFAETDDPKIAFNEMFSSVIPDDDDTVNHIKAIGLDKFIKQTIKSATDRDDVGRDMFLVSLYGNMSGCKTFEEAMVYQRQRIMNSLGVKVIKAVADTAGEAGYEILETMTKIAFATYEKDNGMPIEFELGNMSIKLFDKITKKLIKHKDKILEVPSLIHPDFAKFTEILTGILYDKIEAQFDNLNLSIGKAAEVMPHELYAFKTAYCYALTGFLIGLSAGIFDYKDYDELMAYNDGLLKDKDVYLITQNRSN